MTWEDTDVVATVKKKKRKIKKVFSRVVRRKKYDDVTPLTSHEEGPHEGRSIEVLPSDAEWQDVDLGDVTSSRRKHVTISDSSRVSSQHPDATDAHDVITEKTKKKKKKKLRKKKIRKRAWKAMKSSWTYMKAGLVLMANTSAAWNVTGAVNAVVTDYYQSRDHTSKSYY